MATEHSEQRAADCSQQPVLWSVVSVHGSMHGDCDDADETQTQPDAEHRLDAATGCKVTAQCKTTADVDGDTVFGEKAEACAQATGGADGESAGGGDDTDETQTQPGAERPHCWATRYWLSREPRSDATALSTASGRGTAGANWPNRRRRRRDDSNTVACRLHTAHGGGSECEFVRVDCDRTDSVNLSWERSSDMSQPLPLRRRTESMHCDGRQVHSWGGSEYMYKKANGGGTGTAQGDQRGHRRARIVGLDPGLSGRPDDYVTVQSVTDASSYSHRRRMEDDPYWAGDSDSGSSGSTVCGGEGTGAGRSLTACAADAAAAIVLSMSARQSDVASLRRQSERNGSAVRQLSDAMRTFFCAIADGQHSD